MARVKSGFRKRFNIRYWRWMAARATIGQVSALRQHFSFYPRMVTPQVAAAVVVEDRRFDLPTSFSPAELVFVQDRCWQYDTLAGSWTGGQTVPVRQLTALIRDSWLFGHVGRIFMPSHQAVVMAQGSQANWNFAKARHLNALPPVTGRSFYVQYTDNYYHALFHDLVPIVDYLERLHPPGMPLTLVLPPSRLSILAQGCQVVANAYPGVRCVELPDDAKVQAPEALWLSFAAGNAEWTFGDAVPVRHMAELFRRHYDIQLGHRRRVFFSRGGSKMRRLLNEDTLWQIAQEHGFERFEARADNHAEQVRVFSDADIVIGVHGAGLGNLAFCRPGTRMIEIFPQNFTKSTYLWLSKRLGLDYTFLVGGPGDYDQAFTLDEAVFRAALDGVQ